MTRLAIVVLVVLGAVSGCEREPTNVPEPVAEKTDFAPEEEYELAGGGGGGGDEEVAPGLNGG